MDMSKFQIPKTKDEYIKAHRDIYMKEISNIS